ncbi:MAG: neutral zinc metallopeptidase [Chloroflexota bacterium]|nr:neutral zinc metallopeptidase [Chloroflexota bacterium]
MLRAVALIGLVLVVLAGPARVAAQEETGDAGYSLAQSLIVDVDGFWGGTFALGGWAYSAPTVVPFGGTISSVCGVLDASWGPGFYCPPEGTIYLSTLYADALLAAGDDFAWTTIVAHEWAHHVQVLLGIPYGGVGSELQADCLAGAYTQDAAARGVLDANDVNEAYRLSALSGDANWLPQDAPGAHGSGGDRLGAFLNGYQGGVAGCGIAV